MKPKLRFRNAAPRLQALLALLAALALVACDSDINVTGPQLPEPQPLDTVTDSIWVVGNLKPIDGYCYEARMRYDGLVLAHSFCRAGGDCANFELTGFAPEGSGRHTVELEVMRQEPPGSVLVYSLAVELRDGPLGPSLLSLGPTFEELRAGESFVFEFEMPQF